MQKVIYGYALVEIIGGIFLYFAPQMMFSNPLQTDTILLCKLYGILATCFGLMLLEVGKRAQDQGLIKHVFLLTLAFQLFVGFTCYGFLESASIHIGGMLTHLTLFGIGLVCYFASIK